MAASVAVVGLAPLLLIAPGPVEALPNTCPTGQPDAAGVTITEPAAASVVTGPVTVKGRASGPAGLFRVELFLGESLKDFQIFEPVAAAVDFTLRWDGSGAGPLADLVVVACGGRPGALVRGASAVAVRVDAAPAPAPTVPARLAVAPATGGDRGAGTGPAWVGALFGAAGLAGLAVGAGLRRRPKPPAASPPVPSA